MDNLYSLSEVARAAHVPVRQVTGLVETGQVPTTGGLIDHADAVTLVRRLRGVDVGVASRPPLSLPKRGRRRGALPLMTSSFIHGAVFAVLAGIASLHAFRPQSADPPAHVDLVYLDEPGPGGGGGGGGTETPAPPAPAQVKRVAPPKPKLLSVPPPRPAPVPKPVPVREEPKPLPQLVIAPAAPVAPDPLDVPGVPAVATTASPSNGPGIDGGAGTGAGAGSGEGAGLGPGFGGGTGGGAFQPGSGVTPPTLQREVKPQYTDEARRRAIEGDVVLEILVRRDGSVGNVRVVRSLGAGLDERAIDAVRQWRFGPAKRSGSAVDVSVTVSVGFSLR